ncbi:hypothetical protein [Bradyrhizobium denitrificans]|uniref:hypothetical protein n=1 Tax=Bradyrhizobium denitrificans TaxID=2734912 RepID=UPI001556F0ED|nr:hypothetical protein [Bradyrhizobium sp. LMG 8443]NPU23933.1 hypothetical protein [Bradyrhizobium sp. LMG 8443]
MITSFEVGALFKIIDEASPTLRKILAQVRELNKAVEGAKANMTAVGKNPALAAAIDETKELALAWRDVQKASAAANRSISAASRKQIAGPGAAGVAEAQQLATAWERIAVASGTAKGNAAGIITSSRRAATNGPSVGGAAIAAGGGGGGRGRVPSWPGRQAGSGGSAHISGPALSVPGGAHVRVSGNMGGAALGAAGLLGYGAYEAAQMEDTVFQMMYHAGLEYTDENRLKLRKILQESTRTSGYGLHDIAEAATQEIRMFQGTEGTGPGAGLEVLPEMLKAATTEARLKGGNPKESMQALIGLAHMTKEYDPAAIKALAKDFAFLSISNPSSLQSMERAAGYAVPILQSGLGIDPRDSLLLGTALTRAGATNTKSGTWLREAMVRAMPGTAIFESEKKAERHDELLKKIGLLDKDGNVTWKDASGKLDPLKMLEIAHEGLAKLPLEERAGAERKIFGAQGSGAISLLSDDAVYNQVRNMRAMRDSPEWANRYGTFSQAYLDNSTVQQARTTVAEFNNTMMDLGAHTLPAVNGALKDFKAVLEAIRSITPGAAKDGGTSIAKRALEGAAAGAAGGALIGAFGGPVGAVGGAAIGGVAGTAYGYMEAQGDGKDLKTWIKDYNKALDGPNARTFGAGGKFTDGLFQRQDEQKDRKQLDEFLIELRRQNTGATLGAPGAAPAAQRPVQLNLNIDGKTLAQALSESNNQYLGFPTQAPAADGTGQFYSGDHNISDK